MAIYAATIPNRKTRVLVRAANKTEAMGRFVTVEQLSADQMQDALDKGEQVWRPDTKMPADEPQASAEPPADPPAADKNSEELTE